MLEHFELSVLVLYECFLFCYLKLFSVDLLRLVHLVSVAEMPWC